MLYYAILPVMTLMGAMASFFFKKAAPSGGLLALMKNVYFYLGGGLYFLAAVLNIIVLRHLDYSIVLPLTSITYVWTMVIAYFALHEKITLKKIAGVVLIFVGAAAIAV